MRQGHLTLTLLYGAVINNDVLGKTKQSVSELFLSDRSTIFGL